MASIILIVDYITLYFIVKVKTVAHLGLSFTTWGGDYVFDKPKWEE